MKNVVLFIVIIITLSNNVFSQNKKINLFIGAGISNQLFCSKDFVIETELNYKINNYFSTSFIFSNTSGKCSVFGTHYINYFSADINFYISPFKNNKKNDFKLGGGFSEYIELSNNEFLPGYNFVIENNYLVNQKFIIGLKVFSHYYEKERREELNIGVLLKLGVPL